MTIDEIKSRRAKTAKTRIPPLKQILTPSVIRRILHDIKRFGKDDREYPCPKCDTGELFDNGAMFLSQIECNNPKCDYEDGDTCMFTT